MCMFESFLNTSALPAARLSPSLSAHLSFIHTKTVILGIEKSSIFMPFCVVDKKEPNSEMNEHCKGSIRGGLEQPSV